MENKNNTELESFKSLLSDWKGKVSANKVIHYDNSLKFQKLHYIVGTLSIVLSIFVGSVMLYNIEKQASSSAKIGLGLISIIVAALSTIQILFRHSDRAILHKQCSSKYAVLERDMDILSANPPKNMKSLRDN